MSDQILVWSDIMSDQVFKIILHIDNFQAAPYLVIILEEYASYIITVYSKPTVRGTCI